MANRTPARFTAENGYWPNTGRINGATGCLINARNVWVRGKNRVVSSKGFGGAIANSGGVNPLLNVSNGYGGLTGGGSIFNAFSPVVYMFAGSGNAFVNGVSKGSVLGGSITIWTGAAAFAAGLLPPNAPHIADSGAAGHNNGSYSIAVTAIRTATGGESTISAPSNTISVVNHGITIDQPLTLPAGADKIGIYCTKQDFGDIGPYFHFYDVAWPQSLPYTIKLPTDSIPGWIDAQLGNLAPLDFSPPPACNFCFVINSIVAAAGAYGGAGISPSYPNKPEAFPPSFVLFTPNGMPITAIKGAGIEGGVFVCTSGSVNIVTASQSTISPLNIYPIWPTTGVFSANQITSCEENIVAWIGTRGPVKSKYYISTGSNYVQELGEEASAFAEPVMNFFAANGYNAQNVVVCFDPSNDVYWFINGTVGISYNRHQGNWNAGADMPANIVTAVTDTLNGRMLVSDSSGNLYTPENGSGTSWNAMYQFQGGEFTAFPKTSIAIRGMVSAACSMSIFTNLNEVTANPNATGLSILAKHGSFPHLNLQQVYSYAPEFFGTDAGGTEVWGAEELDVVHPVRI